MRRDARVEALVGARIITGAGRELVGTVLLRDGRIEAVGENLEIPPEARRHDLSGRVITAGWIELDLPVPVRAAGNDDDARVARAWNPRVHPELDAVLALPLAEDRTQELRRVGFTLALIAPEEGIFAGNGALVGLGSASDAPGEDGELRTTVVRDRVCMFARLEHGGGRPRSYPSSRMGAVALLRQTLHDCSWYERAGRDPRQVPGQVRPALNRSLEALIPVLGGEWPVALRTDDVLELLVLERVLSEFEGVRSWYLGSGEEYLWLSELSGLAGEPRLVLPVDFPEPPTIERPDQAERVTLRSLELWARAPENAIRLRAAGIEAALSTRGLKKKSQFPERVRRMIQRGLDRDHALSAVTRIPARMLGVDDELGTVAAGKLAYLTVLDGEPFAEKTRTIEVWIDGRRYPTEPRARADLDGGWHFTFGLPAGEKLLELAIRDSRKHPRLVWQEKKKGRVRGASLRIEGREVSITLDGDLLDTDGFVTVAGQVEPGFATIVGTALLPDGIRVPFRAARHDEPEVIEEPEQPELPAWSAEDVLAVPLGARGRVGGPFAPHTVLVRDATIWTLGPDGILEEADLLVRDGKIIAVGPDLEAPEDAHITAHIIDGRGLHVTPGLVDPHSHTAIIGGINESTQAVTAEVRIGDSIRPHDINLYRQLAGGVTTVQLLHGSANPIGGQSAIIKLRWGEDPEDMKFAGAPPTIKFALGENVKQSNWGDDHTTRYPQSRMGVLEILRDRFLAAREYQEQKRAPGVNPRLDLELEALAEILAGERFIHCHAYRQDEILALMRLGEELGFRVGTFHHVLEGYKVGPEMARHGAGASSFSDWWTYKLEVIDAIPYNGALLRQAGVLTSFNSDDNELARRLNLEAAKAVKYGGVPREEALGFVTLNPARQLHIDDRVGSLEPSKDADFVVWSGDPLSVYSRCLETWIDGKRYFQVAEDAELAARDAARKRELIQAVIGERHEKRKQRRKKLIEDAEAGADPDEDADPDADPDDTGSEEDDP